MWFAGWIFFLVFLVTCRQMRRGSIRWICKYTFSQSYRIMFGSSFESEKGSSLSRKSKIALFAFFDGILPYLLLTNRRYRSRRAKSNKEKNYNNHTISYPFCYPSFLQYPASIPSSSSFFMIIVIAKKLFLHFSLYCCRQTIDGRRLKMVQKHFTY